MRFDLVSVTGPDGFAIAYKAEAEMREALAAVAHIYGWDVRQEVRLDAWGRADLVLRSVGQVFVVELKMPTSQFSTIRKAAQQVAGYRHVLDAQTIENGRGEWVSSYVVIGGSIPEGAADQIAQYDGRVEVVTAAHFLRLLRSFGNPLVAADRLVSATREVDLRSALAVEVSA